MSDLPVADDEFVIRRIPDSRSINQAYFKLRKSKAEFGVSVTRESLTSAAELLQRLTPKAESRVVRARVGDLRALGLEVIAVPLPEDKGHAEIRSAATSLDDHTVRVRIARAFAFVAEEDLKPKETGESAREG